MSQESSFVILQFQSSLQSSDLTQICIFAMANTKLKLHILAILALVPLLLTLILGLIISLILYLYRLAHIVIAKTFRPDLEEALRPVENIFAHDLLDKPSCNICVTMIFDGNVPLKYLQELFHKRVVLCRNSKGELMYPELQKYWVRFGSYNFWKSNSNFHIEEHVRTLDYEFIGVDKKVGDFSASNPCTEDDLKRIFTRLQVHPWKPGQSPWEFLRIPSYKPSRSSSDKTAFIFRIHHTLGDGYSIQRLLLPLVAAEINPILTSKQCNVKKVQRPLLHRIASAASTVYQLAYELVDYGLKFEPDNCKWMGRNGVVGACNFYTTWTDDIPTKILKAVRKKYGVSFNSVAISVVMSAFEKMVADAGLSCPKSVNLFVPVPLPNPQPGLRIHASAGGGECKLSNEDPVTRLQKTEELLQGLGKILPWFTFKALNFCGLLPAIVIKHCARVKGYTVGMTVIPGPQEPCYAGLYKLERVFSNFPAGPIDQDIRGGCTITAFSSFGQTRIVVSMTAATWPFPPSVLEKKLDFYVREELENLNSVGCLTRPSEGTKRPSNSLKVSAALPHKRHGGITVQ